MWKEAGTSFTVADNSVLYQHADHILLRCFIANKRATTMPRQHLLSSLNFLKLARFIV
jgi:hypothetical protein